LGDAEHDLVDRLERYQIVAIDYQTELADLLRKVFGHDGLAHARRSREADAGVAAKRHEDRAPTRFGSIRVAHPQIAADILVLVIDIDVHVLCLNLVVQDVVDVHQPRVTMQYWFLMKKCWRSVTFSSCTSWRNSRYLISRERKFVILIRVKSGSSSD
jgi:hypothetical protein